MILFTLKSGRQVAVLPQDILEIKEHDDSNYSWVLYTLFGSPHYLVVSGKVSDIVEDINIHMNNLGAGESI